MDAFEVEYKKLNKYQKEAVESLEGPIMVVAGPGTGKTQVLALRIANILKKTDIKAHGILCLTFTNAAVGAMRERLRKYIGETGDEVNIFTFHSFGMQIIEKHFKVLGMTESPKLMEEADQAIFFDYIFEEGEWEYLRPRGDSSRYFSDLKSLISLLKRERITEENFLNEVEREIKFLEKDEGNISTRGESKGELKKEIKTKIENLDRTREVAKFIKFYEKAKREQNVLDYDDVLEFLVKIVETSENALSQIRENYLYVLIDEHQDSSRVQNEFLKHVWGNLERPDVFVVGDDRQLIYGFSGASIEHFEGFKKTFLEAKLIPLIDNYRSTQVILDASHALLKSVMSKEKLVSQRKEDHPIRLVELDNHTDEIKLAGFDIKEKVEKKEVHMNDCAILVPNNKQVREALQILHNLGLPVSSLEALNFFDLEEAQAFLRVLKIINNGDVFSLALSFFDQFSGIKPIEAHKFFIDQNMREFSADSLFEPKSLNLFEETEPTKNWTQKLSKWRKDAENLELKNLIESVGNELFEAIGEGTGLVSGRDVIATMLSLLEKEQNRNPEMSLSDFVRHLEKLESYGEHIPLIATRKDGIKVLTMHSSKGLEFDYVWIAHMDERSLNGGKGIGFTLPESIRAKIEERDVDAVKRKLYVAITRAKRFCTLSYGRETNKGTNREIAQVIASLPGQIFKKIPIDESRNIISKNITLESKNNLNEEFLKIIGAQYSRRYISAWLLNNFFECPWKWYFCNFLQLPQPKSENMEFGSAMHAAIDRILQMKNSPTEEEIKTIVKKEAEAGGISTRMKTELFNLIKAWVKTRLTEIKLSRRTEESVSVRNREFSHLSIYGRIDLIENLGPKEVRVTDFKTGRAKKKSEIEKLDEEGRMSASLRQLAMYSYLLKENPKWQVDVRESRLEFVEAKNSKESIYDRITTEEDIRLLLKDIADYGKEVKNGEWVNRPCHYNSYGKNTECEHCKLGKIFT